MPTAIEKQEKSPSYPSLSRSELVRILEQKDQILAHQEQQIEQREQRIAEQQKQLKLLEAQLRLAKQRRFGSSSEKLPFQGELFDEAELEVALSDIEAQLPPKPPKPPRKRREGFSEKLPRIRVDLRLGEEEKAGASKTFFTKVKEELDIIPAQARVIEYWQEKAVFDQGGEPRIQGAKTPGASTG